MRLAFTLILLAAPAAAAPVALTLPQGASVTATDTSPATSYRLLTGPWTTGGGASQMLEGARIDTSWRLRANQDTSLQIFAGLREQIAAAGYTVIYECAVQECGGFDFRYGLDLLPEPEMHVDLGDFRYLAARNGDEWLALTVSRSSESGFVNLTTMGVHGVAPADRTPVLPTPSPAPGLSQSAFGTVIEAQGAVALDDLTFESGAATLGTAEFASLRALADYLATRPGARVALVGHTDTAGGLDANIALSKRRAEAVRSRLIDSYGVTAAQLDAQGVGWLAPRATNLSPEGQDRNRRVEAVLITKG